MLTKKHFSLLILFLVSLNLKSTNINQIEVARQKSGGSCGYHALRNGLLIAESFINPSSRQMLTNESLVEEFENAESDWYKSTINYRAQKLAAYYIKDCILKKVKGRTFKDNNTSNRSYALNLENKYIELKELKDLTYPDERHFFCNLLIEVANRLSKEANLALNKEIKYEITRQRIIEIIKEEIKKNEPSYNQFNLSEKIKYFFPKLRSIVFSITNDNIISNSKDEVIYQRNYRSNNTRKSSSTVTNSGEWLSSEDIARLVRQEYSKSNSFLKRNINKVRVFILDNQFEHQFKNQEDLKELVVNLKRDNFEGTGVFVIYCNSHWLTCVLNKQKYKEIEYIFADSLNFDRLQDENTIKLINLLSGNFNNEEDIYNDNIKVEYTKTKLPPLELLLQGRNLVTVQNIISQLKKNEAIRQGLLLQGPAGVGKHTIAQVIAQQSGKELISTLQEEVKVFFNQPDDKLKEDIDLEEILLSLIKRAYKKGAILLICKIEEFLKTKSLNRLSRIANQNQPFLVLGTTRDNTLIDSEKILKSFLEPISIELPNYELRRSILSHYLVSNNMDLSGTNNETRVCNAVLDALSTATRQYSGSELEDIVNLASEGSNQNILLKSEPSFYYRWENQYDFRDKKLFSYCAILPCSAWVPILVTSYTSKIERYLWAMQYEYDQQRDKKIESGYLDKAKILGLVAKDYATYYGKEFVKLKIFFEYRILS